MKRHLKGLSLRTLLPCLHMPVSLAWLGCMASEPAGCAEGRAGTGTLKQPQRNMSEELPWPNVDSVHAVGFQELVNMRQNLLN